jgi:hypothetical protein
VVEILASRLTAEKEAAMELVWELCLTIDPATGLTQGYGRYGLSEFEEVDVGIALTVTRKWASLKRPLWY